MKDGQYVNIDKQRAEHYFYTTERFADFLEWLFDTELWYTSQSEMWGKFEEWEDKNNENQTKDTKS